MKVVLFCGGLGTRLREHSDTIPKPLVPIGGRPIIWHIMRYYAHFGHKDFILCLGYRGDLIRQYFLEYNAYLVNDFVFSKSGAVIDPAISDIDDWTIRFVDTGMHSNIAQRLVAIKKYLDDDLFLANYSDQLSDLPLNTHIDSVLEKDVTAGFVSVRPPQSYHSVQCDDQGFVTELRDSSETEVWINGGYFVFRREIFDEIGPEEELVVEPFQRLAKRGQLWTNKYGGFWRSMDTFKDKITFDRLDSGGQTPWKVWDS